MTTDVGTAGVDHFAVQGGEDVRHRTLGHTGLIVSEVALGSMQFGGQMNMGNLGQD